MAIDTRDYFYSTIEKLTKSSLNASTIRLSSKSVQNLESNNLKLLLAALSPIDMDLVNFCESCRCTISYIKDLSNTEIMIAYVYYDENNFMPMDKDIDNIRTVKYKNKDTIIIYRNNVDKMIEENVTDEQVLRMVINELESIIFLANNYNIDEYIEYAPYIIATSALKIQSDKLLDMLNNIYCDDILYTTIPKKDFFYRVYKISEYLKYHNIRDLFDFSMIYYIYNSIRKDIVCNLIKKDIEKENKSNE